MKTIENKIVLIKAGIDMLEKDIEIIEKHKILSSIALHVLKEELDRRSCALQKLEQE